MKILVTGGVGFVGTNTCEYFAKQGHDVIAFDNMSEYELSRSGYAPHLKLHNIEYLKNLGVTVINGDILNLALLKYHAKSTDFIIHTAAQPAMTIAIEYPILDFETNARGTFNVLETARRYDIPIINCSSIHVYGNKLNNNLTETKTRFIHEPSSFSEDQPILQGDITPLHASKRTTELYTEAYIDTYGLSAANFRLTGMYGPWQFAGMDHGWVANFAIRTLLQKPIIIFDTPKQVRDILYIDDVTRAFEAFYNNQVSGTYNVGGGMSTAISLQESLTLMHNITNIHQNINILPKRKGDLYYFVSNIEKIKQNLKWEPHILPEEGITKMINWINSHETLFGNIS